MAAGRTLRSLLSRRRRGENEEEEDDEGGPVAVEDSQSEASNLSEGEGEEGDASGSDDVDGVEAITAQTKTDVSPVESKSKRARKLRKRSIKQDRDALADSSEPQNNFKAMADTEAMMNGLGISEEREIGEQEAVDFENMESTSATVPNAVTTNGNGFAPTERQRREQHEEYRRKRDSNPAFIPNRGNFFMHDTRGQANGQAPRSQGPFPGRPRPRGGLNVGGPFSPANQTARAERAAEQTWKHDLHDTINEELPAHPSHLKAPTGHEASANNVPRAMSSKALGQPRVLNFSMERVLGLVQIHVSFPGMKAPASFPNIKWKQYTRLPDHRPPLRRDKAVQVLLPGGSPKPAFPQTERSFVFIPRQNRPKCSIR